MIYGQNFKFLWCNQYSVLEGSLSCPHPQTHQTVKLGRHMTFHPSFMRDVTLGDNVTAPTYHNIDTTPEAGYIRGY